MGRRSRWRRFDTVRPKQLKKLFPAVSRSKTEQSVADAEGREHILIDMCRHRTTLNDAPQRGGRCHRRQRDGLQAFLEVLRPSDEAKIVAKAVRHYHSADPCGVAATDKREQNNGVWRAVRKRLTIPKRWPNATVCGNQFGLGGGRRND